MFICFLTMIDKLHICTAALAPCYSEAKDESEMITQLLFGQLLVVLEKCEGNWLKIKNLDDNYEAWISSKQVEECEPKLRYDECYVTKQTLGRAVSEEDSLFLPAGSRLYNLKNNYFNHNGKRYKWESGYNLVIADVELLALNFLNAPYLWGGKSILGMDCSGLIQLVYSLFEHNIPRDSGDQKKASKKIEFVNKRLGDLAFFKNKKGNVNHVGFVLDNNEIIHASGKVRIDTLTTDGIINKETNKLSHIYESIGRINR